MPEEEGELVVDAAVAVGQVGVAHTAGGDLHHHLARTRIRDRDRGDLDGLALGTGNDTSDLLRHVDSSLPGVGA